MAATRVAIQIGTFAESGNKTTQNFSFNHTGEDKPERVVIVFVAARDTATQANTIVSSITYGGTAMTLIDNQSNTAGGATWMTANTYIIMNPPAGLNSVAVTMGGTPEQAYAAAATFWNVDQVTPQDVTHTGTGAGTANPAISITTATDGAVCIGCIAFNNNTGVAPASGQAEQVDAGDGTNYELEVNTITKATAGSQAMNLTCGGSHYGYTICALRPRRRKIRVMG
jgi:hypothetical protein